MLFKSASPLCWLLLALPRWFKFCGLRFDGGLGTLLSFTCDRSTLGVYGATTHYTFMLPQPIIPFPAMWSQSLAHCSRPTEFLQPPAFNTRNVGIGSTTHVAYAVLYCDHSTWSFLSVPICSVVLRSQDSMWFIMAWQPFREWDHLWWNIDTLVRTKISSALCLFSWSMWERSFHTFSSFHSQSVGHGATGLFPFHVLIISNNL